MFQDITIIVKHPNGDTETSTPFSYEGILTVVRRFKRVEDVYLLKLPAEQFVEEGLEVTGDYRDRISGTELAETFVTWRISKGFRLIRSRNHVGRKYLFNQIRTLQGVVETQPGNKLWFNGIRFKPGFMQTIEISETVDEDSDEQPNSEDLI